MRKGPAVVVVLLAAALVGLLSYGIASRGEDRTIDQALFEGKRPVAPDRTLALLGAPAERASLADYKGQVVLLNFWASWCPPCVEELPLLERTQKKLRTQNATVVGVNLRDVAAEALTFVDRFGLSYPSLRDPDADFARDYGATGYPETFVLDRQGRIAAKRRGPVTQEWLDRTLPPLLAEPA